MPMTTSAARLPTRSWPSGEAWLCGRSREGGSSWPGPAAEAQGRQLSCPWPCSKGFANWGVWAPRETCGIIWRPFWLFEPGSEGELLA